MSFVDELSFSACIAANETDNGSKLKSNLIEVYVHPYSKGILCTIRWPNLNTTSTD